MDSQRRETARLGVGQEMGVKAAALARLTRDEDILVPCLGGGPWSEAGLHAGLEATGHPSHGRRPADRTEAPRFREFLAHAEAELGARHRVILIAKENLAVHLRARGKLAEALQLPEGVLEIRRSTDSPLDENPR